MVPIPAPLQVPGQSSELRVRGCEIEVVASMQFSMTAARATDEEARSQASEGYRGKGY